MMNQMEPLKKLSLPVTDQATIMALSILIERIGTLPRADRNDLFDLVQALRDASEPAERDEIAGAMNEILIGSPKVTTRSMPQPPNPAAEGDLRKLTNHIGGTIKQLRVQRDFTQGHLATLAGITQSHVSRIESGELSATHMTLEKIAKALNVQVRDLDPCSD